MATPTPSYPPHPGSASKKPTGHVSTPSHLGLSSPAPRSVPSPAAMRKDQAGKTPINHSTTGSSGSKTLGSTPMVYNLSQQGLTSSSSPSANLLSFGTPIGLGVEGITPSQLNMATPAIGGVPMTLTMSDLGAPSNTASQKRNEDEERRARMRKVLKSIGKPKGRVSEEGITRVSKRVGFDDSIDEGTKEERLLNPGIRKLSMAGKKVLVDVTLKEDRPQIMSVMFDTESQGLMEQHDAVRDVLFSNLQQKVGEVSLDAKLEKFAANMERLAKVDRLSSQHLNCFEALSGVYTSLRRLHGQEAAVAKEREVMRKRSGRPAVHANGRIGLEVAYWQQPPSVNSSEDNAPNEDTAFRLRLGVERSASGMYPSIRVFDDWLPNPLELPAADAGQDIPWQEPPPTLVPSNTDGDAMAIDGEQKIPDLRFTAKLDPPVVVPWQTALNILQLLGLPAPQLFVMPPAWHALVLNPSSVVPVNGASDQSISATQSVLSMRSGEENDVTHIYALDVPKPDAGYKLTELPFSHPRQLVELLPTLRQWACFGTFVRDLFDDSTPKSDNNDGTAAAAQAPLSLDDLLTPPATPPFNDILPVSVSLATSPVPTLSFSFPTAVDKPVRSVTVQVLQNGDLTVVDSHGAARDADMTGVENDVSKKLAKALEACGDVGVWIEWLRSRT